MKKLKLISNALFITQLLFLIGCSSNPDKVSDSASKKNDYQENIPSDIEYKIVSNEANDALSKREVIVELNKRVQLDVLENIAYVIKGESQFEKNWIFYHLPNHKDGDAAWAISHFTPDLELEIIGTTIEQEEKLKEEPKVLGEVVGKWKDQISSLTIFKDEAGYKLKTQYKDGGSSIDELKRSMEGGNARFDYNEDLHGEYFIIEANGNLGMYGNDGKFGEAESIK